MQRPPELAPRYGGPARQGQVTNLDRSCERRAQPDHHAPLTPRPDARAHDAPNRALPSVCSQALAKDAVSWAKTYTGLGFTHQWWCAVDVEGVLRAVSLLTQPFRLGFPIRSYALAGRSPAAPCRACHPHAVRAWLRVLFPELTGPARCGCLWSVGCAGESGNRATQPTPSCSAAWERGWWARCPALAGGAAGGMLLAGWHRGFN